MTEATGERLVPGEQHGELVHAEHLARYRFAAALARGKRVLDAASGEGYGSALLAAAGATSVAGVDIDEPTVKGARERYGLDFRVADVESLPFEDGEFDLVISFETIEHVQNPEAVLAELARVLDPAGAVVISTPNKDQSLVSNQFHVREFTHDEFLALLCRRFPSVRVLYQHNWTTSALLEEADFRERSGDRPLDLSFYKVMDRAPGEELYTVAVCGREIAGLSVAEVAVAAGTDEAHALANRVLEAEQVARDWHREYERAEDTAERWHGEFEQAKLTAERWHAEYQAIVRSRAWRLTVPLRRLAGLSRRRK